MRVLLTVALLLALPAAARQDARAIVQAAIDHYRGSSSQGEMTMIIHREDWERRMTMAVWTSGEEQSLVRVLEPVRDAGNGTLSLDGNMWTYTPKINRIIKIPASMMNQNWMGSDFSNRDVSRSNDIVDQYTHELLATREEDGHRVYRIASTPLPDAAVVWGREELEIRDDWVLLRQDFYDQDGVLVKSLVTSDIREISGRTVAAVMRMTRADEPGEWTEMRTLDIRFDLPLADTLFTLANLRNPRE
jgi:outer membrane lipoprotein-sorting protein